MRGFKSHESAAAAIVSSFMASSRSTSGKRRDLQTERGHQTRLMAQSLTGPHDFSISMRSYGVHTGRVQKKMLRFLASKTF